MTNTDALTGKLLEVINQVQGGVSAHSAEAASLVMTSTRIDGICWLVAIFIAFVLSSYLTYYFIKSKDEDGTVYGGVLLSLCFLFLIYPWNWIQVFDPKLYLAHEIIGKVLQ